VTVSTHPFGFSKRGASTGEGGGVGRGGGEETEKGEMAAGNGQDHEKMRKEEAGRRVPPREPHIAGSGLRSAAELPPTTTQIQVCQNNTRVLPVCLCMCICLCFCACTCTCMFGHIHFLASPSSYLTDWPPKIEALSQYVCVSVFGHSFPVW